MGKKTMEFTGERVIEGCTPIRIWLDHQHRYQFAARYAERKTVLDISCGTGYGTYLLKESGADRVSGVDIADEAINYARSRYKSEKIEFKTGDVRKIDFPEDFFDVVVCFETIEHIDENEKAVKEFYRVLKKDGTLIISSPNSALTSPFAKLNNPFHIEEYTLKEFKGIIENEFQINGIFGQRGVYKIFMIGNGFFWGKKIFFHFYNSEIGSSKMEKFKKNKEYRYITLVCKKK